MTITIIRSTDGGAPQLSGQAGAMNAVLRYCLVTTLGWTEPYTSAGNIAAFKSNVGNLRYLRVDDSNATETKLVGYESLAALTPVPATDFAFPTAAQFATGLFSFKSNAASSATRPWVFFSDGRIFHLFYYQSGTTFPTSGGSAKAITFGDFTSFKTGDAFNTILIAETSAGSTSSFGISQSSAMQAATGGHYVPRPYTQIGTSVNANKYTDNMRSTGSTLGSGGLVYPAPIEGGLIMAPLWIGDGVTGTNIGSRGLLPGLWVPCHNRPLVHGDTFTGTGTLAGRTFEAMSVDASAQLMVDLTGPWS